jgi:hypothetical protein
LTFFCVNKDLAVADVEPLISLSEAARRLGINKSILWRQAKAGTVRSRDGKFKFSEVVEDRARNVDASRNPKNSIAAPLPETKKPNGRETRNGGDVLSFAEERARKERAVASLREQELEKRSGKLINREMAERAAFDFAREFRDGLTNWPARVAAVMAAELGVDQVRLHVILEKHLREFLAEFANSQLRLAGGTGTAGNDGPRGDAGADPNRLGMG